MEFLLNAAQMKHCDRDTIDRIGIPSPVLMERAALSVVDEMEKHQLNLDSVLVLCGSGNNGGDGFAIARLLDEQGIRVTVSFVGRETSMTEETLLQRRICENCGIKISTNFQNREYTTIVDAIFGIGLSRTVEGRYAELIDWINHQSASVVAVDIPSGISADTGKVLGAAVQADLTVTFAYRKIGQILYPGCEYCGQIVRRDIGITAADFRKGIPAVFTYGEEDLQRIVRRRAYSNKGTYGKVLLVAGSHGMSGAACLAGLAAYRCGSGLVRIFTPECNREVIQTYLPEAIVTAYGQENRPIVMLREAMSWADVIGIGPGLGVSPLGAQLLETVLQESDKPVVVDADGLNLLAKQPSLLPVSRVPVILTPHIGEMMRLTGTQKSDITEDIIAAASRYSGENHVICVLKDARTAVSDGSRTYLNTSGNNGMAVAGSGDILTGIICGLLGQGMQPFDGAALGVYLHGLSGDLAREKYSAYGMIARDIAGQIGEVLKKADVNDISGGDYEKKQQNYRLHSYECSGSQF